MSRNGPFPGAGIDSPPDDTAPATPRARTVEERLVSLEAGQLLLAASLQQRNETEQALLVLIRHRADQLESALSNGLAALDKRLKALEQVHILPPGELDFFDAYQLIVNELGDMKKVVLALQREARIEGETPPSSLQSLNPIRH